MASGVAGGCCGEGAACDDFVSDGTRRDAADSVPVDGAFAVAPDCRGSFDAVAVAEIFPVGWLAVWRPMIFDPAKITFAIANRARMTRLLHDAALPLALP